MPHDTRPGPPAATPAPLAPAPRTDEFSAAFGEPLSAALDLATWHPARHLGDLHAGIEDEVRASIRQDESARRAIRAEIFPRLAARDHAPIGAGVFRADEAALAEIQRGLLFQGLVEAGNGIAIGHDGLSLAVTQVGVCLVSYLAEQGSWVHRLYRRDLRYAAASAFDLALELVERRHGTVRDDPGRAERLSELARRGIMAYAERAALVEQSRAVWRMGHGNPLAYELLTGSGSGELLLAGLALLRRLVGDHRRFVFVPSGLVERGLLTLGDALAPLEYLIFDTMTDRMERIVAAANANYVAQHLPALRSFIAEIGPQVVVGCYRASAVGPARVFYAHVEHAHEAALIALADSRLQEHRGFPTLLDLADAICRTTFGAPDLVATVRDAYAVAGKPYQFHQEFGRRG